MGAQAAKNTTLTPISSRLVRRRLACFRRNVWVLVAASGSRGTAVAILARQGWLNSRVGASIPIRAENDSPQSFQNHMVERANYCFNLSYLGFASSSTPLLTWCRRWRRWCRGRSTAPRSRRPSRRCGGRSSATPAII